MLGREVSTNEIFDVVIDIDGVLSADQVTTDSAKYAYRFSQKGLPLLWQDYHKDHVVTVNYENKIFHHLLLPGALEMLQFFFINLKDKVRVSFFSAGLEARNKRYCEIIKEMVARNAGVSPDIIEYKLYSRDHCEKIKDGSDLQPRHDNNPYIPNEHGSVAFRDSTVKKRLSNLFENTARVILVDDQCNVIINHETSNLLKVFYCGDFSSFDLRHYSTTETDKELQILTNLKFLNEDIFYAVNHSTYVIGLMLAVIQYSEKNKVSPVAALEFLQLCPEKNKYKYALHKNPDYVRYDIEFYKIGFEALLKINPNLVLFLPYPQLFLETLELHKNYFLLQPVLQGAMGYDKYKKNIFDIIQEYHGTLTLSPALLRDRLFTPKKINHTKRHNTTTLENRSDSTPDPKHQCCRVSK